MAAIAIGLHALGQRVEMSVAPGRSGSLLLRKAMREFDTDKEIVGLMTMDVRF